MKSIRPCLAGFLLWAAPATVQAQFDYTINGGAVTITGYSGFPISGTLSIPSAINNMPVTGIGDYAFNALNAATIALIPATVTNIGDGAFSGCFSMTAMVVDPSNSYYSDLDGVLFNKELTTLVEYPAGLPGDYTIPESVNNIDVGAFAQCAGLTSVTIPATVNSIGDYAFENCAALTGVIIPVGVTNIGQGSFSGCASLTTITVSAQNPSYASVNGVLFDKSESTLLAFPGGFSGGYAAPDGVTNIEWTAFQNCKNLTNLTIPAPVSNIGTGTFFGCSTLKSINVNAQNSSYSSVNGVLFDKNQTTLLAYPPGIAGGYAILSGVKSIGVEAFQNCSKLSGITIPATVTNIDEAAFDYCSSLTSVTIPGTVADIGTGAFENCSGLTVLSIGVGVANIESNAFSHCYSLGSVTIPGSVAVIGQNAFEYCLSLAGVNLVNGVGGIGESAFIFCSGMTSVTIPNSVTNIGKEAFGYCSSLLHVSIPASVTSISPETFYECAGLTSVTIPGTVTNVGVGAFEQCYSLSSLTIANGVASIGDSAFGDCSSLKTAAIPASVTAIGNGVFSDCSSLTTITVDAQNPSYSSTNGVLFDKLQTTLVEYPGGLSGAYAIPSGTSQIGDYAFINCQSLTGVTIPGTVTNIGVDAFENCFALGAITIPKSVASIGDFAFAETDLTNFYFAGDAPALGNFVFDSANSPFIYYLPKTTGWPAFSVGTGLSPIAWNPVIQSDATLGVQNGDFGFNITGPTNAAVVVNTCSNLASPNWIPLTTVTLTNGMFRFSEPTQTNTPARFFSLGLP